ncbi:hypothetical protein POM88_001751 [Heracleum sosnowskyi]|uniref:Uncharacterized protein n=1 Tax=Heracleum sosnowskyi TaxID=360622 RepID=A0AAD8JGG8_9APIA|nr:hypothetical protein POM88_001751 [Heracleum sosnowskyi]
MVTRPRYGGCINSHLAQSCCLFWNGSSWIGYIWCSCLFTDTLSPVNFVNLEIGSFRFDSRNRAFGLYQRNPQVCYAVAYLEDRTYSKLAPFGGFAFIAGWATLLF